MEKIAIVVDSGSDVSEKIAEGLDIYSLPLRIYVDGDEFTDGVDITSDEIFAVLDDKKVTTSLPTGEDILGEFEKIKAMGYTHVIAIAISSGLSGTFNVIRNLSESMEGLEFFVLDTKNISLGSGFLALYAAELVKEGKGFDEIVSILKNSINQSKVFFTVGTLDYLIKGGRIGMVAGTVANVLNIKPIISCNEEGIYHTVAKVRGYSRVIKRMIDTAADFVKDSPKYKVMLVNAASKENLEEVKAYALSKFQSLKDIEIVNITPALAIHTGPEALGVAVMKLA